MIFVKDLSRIETKIHIYIFKKKLNKDANTNDTYKNEIDFLNLSYVLLAFITNFFLKIYFKINSENALQSHTVIL